MERARRVLGGLLLLLAACRLPPGEDLLGAWQRSLPPTGERDGFIRFTFAAGGSFEYLSQSRSTVDAGVRSAGCTFEAAGPGTWTAEALAGGERQFTIAAELASTTQGCEVAADNQTSTVPLQDTFRYLVERELLAITRLSPDGGLLPTLSYFRVP